MSRPLRGPARAFFVRKLRSSDPVEPIPSTSSPLMNSDHPRASRGLTPWVRRQGGDDRSLPRPARPGARPVVFLVAGLPMLGYAVLAGVWLAGAAIEGYGYRRSRRELAEGNRRQAMGWVARDDASAASAGHDRGPARRPARRPRGRPRRRGARGDPVHRPLRRRGSSRSTMEAPPGSALDEAPGRRSCSASASTSRIIDRPLPHLRQRRQERRVPAAERVQARALDPRSRSPASTCRSTRRSSTCSSPRR